MDQSTNATNSPSKGTTTAAAVGVVLLVVGLLVGFGITKAADNNKIKKADDKSMSMGSSSSMFGTTSATKLQTTLVALGVNHMNYTDQAVDAALDGSPNATQLDDLLNQNGKDIGAAVGSVYGSSAMNTFDQVWQLHLNDFVKYAVADSQGNSTAAQAALTDIDTNYTKPLAQYLAKANPNLPEATLESALRDHVDMTAKMIDDHVQKNYTAEASQLDMANVQIGSLFQTLSQAIVKQYPSKFSS